MALISCPECAKTVSDKAVACPNCGFPISEYLKEQKSENELNTNHYVVKNNDDVSTAKDKNISNDVVEKNNLDVCSAKEIDTDIIPDFFMIAGNKGTIEIKNNMLYLRNPNGIEYGKEDKVVNYLFSYKISSFSGTIDFVLNSNSLRGPIKYTFMSFDPQYEEAKNFADIMKKYAKWNGANIQKAEKEKTIIQMSRDERELKTLASEEQKTAPIIVSSDKSHSKQTNSTKPQKDKKQKPKSKKKTIFIIFLILYAFAKCGSDDKTDTSKITDTDTVGTTNEVSQLNSTDVADKDVPSESVETEPKLTAEEQLMVDLKSLMSEDVAEKAYDIILNQIGFTNVKYVGVNDVGSFNYNFEADVSDFTLTADDDVYRIFQPYGPVFYENDKVIKTIEQYKSTIINDNDRIKYFVIAQNIVDSCLAIPESAKYPTSAYEANMQKNGDLIAVQGTVKSKNALGTYLTTNWTVEYKVIDLDSFNYETVYVKVGNNSAGNFIPLE